MAKFRIDSIGALARQMTFTPHDARALQVTATEQLLIDIDPAKAYPLDFVIYRITGYRPKAIADDLLTGLALQHDLGLLVEFVSDSLNLRSAASSEPVLTIDDVTEKFNVTSKTIQRWRRKGLPARRFIFPDGKRRVGFLLNSVERFIVTHGEQVQRTTNFSQVDDPERQEIIRRARRLATHGRCCVDEISRRVGRKLNRSPLTILHTIRKFDQDQPDEAVFSLADEALSDEERHRIGRAFRKGVSIAALARRIRRPRSAIYRVVIDERLAKINKRKVKFIDDPLYHQPDAGQVIQEIVSQQELSEQRKTEELRIPRDLPPYLQELYRTPLLSPTRERALFLKLNFHKYQFVSARRRIDPQMARSRDLRVLEGHLRQVTDSKNAIVRANLRLVVSVARKHLRPGLNLMELISDGNLTLMRAVDSFDLHRGHRFSTYATLALMKGFARSVPMMLGSGRRAASIDDSILREVADTRPTRFSDRLIERDEVRQLLSRLSERERRVLLAHYGLDGDAGPSTYEQVGEKLGLSKHHVRQIEQRALEKLRAAVS